MLFAVVGSTKQSKGEGDASSSKKRDGGPEEGSNGQSKQATLPGCT